MIHNDILYNIYIYICIYIVYCIYVCAFMIPEELRLQGVLLADLGVWLWRCILYACVYAAVCTARCLAALYISFFRSCAYL